MATVQRFPHKFTQLGEPGFRKVIARAKRDSALASAIADQLRKDPRALIRHIFILNEAQEKALDKAAETDLSRFAVIFDRIAKDPSFADREFQFGHTYKGNVRYLRVSVGPEEDVDVECENSM